MEKAWKVSIFMLVFENTDFKQYFFGIHFHLEDLNILSIVIKKNLIGTMIIV